MKKRVKVPFRQRYADSRRIAKETLRLVNAERDLWVFPIVSALAFLVAILAASFWMFNFIDELVFLGTSVPMRIAAGTLVMGIPFLPIAILVSLLNAAYAWALYQRMEGRDATPRQAWARAWAHMGVIVRFQLIAMVVSGVLAVVGQFLAKLQWIPGVGRVVQTVGTFAWAAAAFFVIPIIVVERERRAWGALTRSAAIGRSQWGKTVAGIVTIALVFLVPFTAIALVGAAIMMYGVDLGQFTAIMVGMGVMFFALGLMFLVMPLNLALQTTYQTALYRFAVTGRISAPFTVETMHSVWAPYRGEE